MSDYFSIRKSIVYLVLTSALLSGCTTLENRDYRRQDLTKNEQEYSDRVQMRSLSEKDRYDIEKEQNKGKDILKKINPDIMDPINEFKDSLDGMVGMLPQKPKIGKKGLVWERKW